MANEKETSYFRKLNSALVNFEKRIEKLELQKGKKKYPTAEQINKKTLGLVLVIFAVTSLIGKVP